MDSGQNLGWRYNGGIEFHQGIDCGGGGEEIKNTTGFDMIVVGVSTEDTPYGYYVKIRLSGTNYYLIYQHLSQINVGINQTIAAGSNQIIAYTGGTGGVDPHLHLTLTTDSQLMFSTNPTIIKQFYDPRIIFK